LILKNKKVADNGISATFLFSFFAASPAGASLWR